MSRLNELRFKVSPELTDKIKELEKLGEFDSVGGAARFVLSIAIDGVLSQTKLIVSGETPTSIQQASPPPQNPLEPAQQALTPPSQPTPPVGGFGNSFSAIKDKVAS